MSDYYEALTKRKSLIQQRNHEIEQAKKKAEEEITRKYADWIGDDRDPWKEVASKIGGNEPPQVLRF